MLWRPIVARRKTMFNFTIRIITEILLASVLAIIFSLVNKDMLKGKKGKQFFAYLFFLTIFVIVLGIAAWIILKKAI